MSRSDIECPEDIVPFNCSIQSNSETLHLIWRVNVPGQVPINITYDNISSLYEVDFFNNIISTSLQAFESDNYIESTLELTLSRSVSTNRTRVGCIIDSLGNDSILVTIDSKGEYCNF